MRVGDVDTITLHPATVSGVQKNAVGFGTRACRQICGTVCTVEAFSMLFLTAQQTFMPLMVRAANKDTKFISTTSVFLMEVLRIVACSSILSFKFGSPLLFAKKFFETVWDNKLETLKVCVPAVVYAVQNNLFYVALANIDATTFTVTYQLRILTTALLSVLMLNQILSRAQWLALLISLFGVVLVQLDQGRPMTKLAIEGRFSIVAKMFEGNRALGIAAVVSMCWTSAFAGVYFEKMLKKEGSADVFMQNLRLSMLTLPFATITMLISDFESIRDCGLFQGWTPLVWLVTLSSAAGGIMVAVVVKYADNVRKTYCQTVAIVLTATLSVMLADSQLSVNLVFGVFLVVISVFLYSLFPPKTYSSLQKQELLVSTIRKP